MKTQFASWIVTACLAFVAAVPAAAHETFKDLWSKKVSKNVRGGYGGIVTPHGVIMVRVTLVV